MNEENYLYGLAYNCPAKQRQDDCPLNVMEHLSFKEKVNWINELSKEEKKVILEQHQVCSGNK